MNTHFGSSFDAIEEALFRMSVDSDEVRVAGGRRPKERYRQQHQVGGHHFEKEWNVYQTINKLLCCCRRIGVGRATYFVRRIQFTYKFISALSLSRETRIV